MLETLIAHGSDWIQWLDVSGLQAGGGQPVSTEGFRLNLTHRPENLKVIHKSSMSVLWITGATGMVSIAAGKAGAADLLRPALPSYELNGALTDTTGCFLPRLFGLKLGTGAGAQVRLYRSPMGTRYTQGGGAQGRVLREDGSPLSWALVCLTVQPLGSPVMEYVAQADALGEFRLALDRLPPLPKDAHVSSYTATLKIRANLSNRPDQPIDPEKLGPIQVCAGKTIQKKLRFSNGLGVTLVPGMIATLYSPGQTAIVLKSS